MDEFDDCVMAYSLFVSEAEMLLMGRASNNPKNNDQTYRDKVTLLLSQT